MTQIIALHKNELARLLGITTRTMAIWLNDRYYSELVKLGYQKNQKVLLPSQVRFITGKLDVSTNETV